MDTEHVLIVSGIAPARRAFAARVATPDAALSFAALLPPPAQYPPRSHWSAADGNLVAALLTVSDPDAFPLLSEAMTPMGLNCALWRSATWGTRDDAGDVRVEDERPEDDEWTLRYRFLASTPPIPWVQAASATDARVVLRLTSANGNADAVACVTAHSGRIIQERYGDFATMAADLAAARL